MTKKPTKTTEAIPMTERGGAFPCCFCGAPISSIMSRTSCDNCTKVWNMAYDEGRKFEREYGERADGERSQMLAKEQK